MDEHEESGQRPEGVPDLEALEKEVEVTVFVASGPGGQHRNRTYSAVRVRHIHTGITITCADTRSQIRNRRLAMERLRQRLLARARRQKPRIPTRKSRRVRRKELEAKRRRGRIKRLRKRPTGDD